MPGRVPVNPIIALKLQNIFCSDLPSFARQLPRLASSLLAALD